MSMRIEMVASPGDEERSAIVKPLRTHNRAKAGDPKIETIALLVRDEHTQEVLGGLWAEVFYRWLYIELLAIPEQSRGQGIGTRLMGMAEEVAREKGCIGIWLDTFDFQAPGFYERNGFSRFANLEDFPPGHTRFYYQKRLV
jgi:GNAT superfamily N-acetyltransferase